MGYSSGEGVLQQPIVWHDLLQEQIKGSTHSSGQQETVAALQAEVARLEAAQSIQRAADSALDSLQDKIAVLKVGRSRGANGNDSHLISYADASKCIVGNGACISACLCSQGTLSQSLQCAAFD